MDYFPLRIRRGKDHERMSHVVVFLDIVGFTKRDSNEKMHAALEVVNHVVNDVFYSLDWALEVEEKNKLILIPTGDGYAIGFSPSIEDIEILEHVKNLYKKLRDQLNIRIGISKGENYIVEDLNDDTNLIGWCINHAYRILSIAEKNQILCAAHFASPLKETHNIKELKEIRKCYKVKHGYEIQVYNYYKIGEFGNCRTPRQ